MGLSTPLGQYLRARRELVRPEDVGLAKLGRRRVPGLRREELATLAGISADYYLRLEQGRDNHPSPQVIDALARALKLDEGATAHLRALSYPATLPARPRPAASDRAPASIEQLIALWPNTPAFVNNRYLDIVAANGLSIALNPAFTPGVNALRAVFLDPAMRTLFADWENVAQSAVGRVRALVGPDVDDPRLTELASELSSQSPEFRRLWARHDVLVTPARSQTFNHPLVGSLRLQIARLAIVGADRQVLIVKHAEPGSESERTLARLAAIAGESARA